MYTTAEEARSDLFLAGAVYLFGPLLLQFVGPVFGIPVLGALLAVVAPLLTTALVPVLLARYRKEGLADYGLGTGGSDGLRLGLVLAVPIVVGAALSTAALGEVLPGALPSVVLGRSNAVLFAVSLTNWVGLVVLAVYATVKGRDAFRPDLRSVSAWVTEIGRIIGVVAAVAALLLAVSRRADPSLLVLVPLGVAASVLLLLRRYVPTSTATRAALLSPTVLLAWRPFEPFALLVSPQGFVFSVWSAAVLGGIGLLLAATVESRRTAWPAVGVGGLLALLVPIGLIG
jgi:hypothetical protein